MPTTTPSSLYSRRGGPPPHSYAPHDARCGLQRRRRVLPLLWPSPSLPPSCPPHRIVSSPHRVLPIVSSTSCPSCIVASSPCPSPHRSLLTVSSSRRPAWCPPPTLILILIHVSPPNPNHNLLKARRMHACAYSPHGSRDAPSSCLILASPRLPLPLPLRLPLPLPLISTSTSERIRGLIVIVFTGSPLINTARPACLFEPASGIRSSNGA